MRRLVALAIVATATVSSCGHSGDKGESAKPVVFVSVAPQAYLAQRIVDGLADVEVLVPPGKEPHTYEPTPRQMARLSHATVFFRIGMPFEDTLLPKLAGEGRLTIVDARQALSQIPSEDKDEPGMDPHIWMSVRLARVQADNMCREMAKLDPAHKARYERNTAALDADLQALDARIAAALAPLKGRTFYVFHPAFGYFARDYGLKQQTVEVGGKSPGPRHVKDLIDMAKTQGVRVIFVEPQFSQQAAQAIAEQIGGAVVPLDPLSENYLANLWDVAEKIKAALAPSASAPESARNATP